MCIKTGSNDSPAGGRTAVRGFCPHCGGMTEIRAYEDEFVCDWGSCYGKINRENIIPQAEHERARVIRAQK